MQIHKRVFGEINEGKKKEKKLNKNKTKSVHTSTKCQL